MTNGMSRPNLATRPSLRLLLALLVGLASFAFASRPALADDPAPDRPTKHLEMHMMEMMDDHHAMGFDMAQMCLAKATMADLRTMCSQMLASDPAMMAMMQSWLWDWYGIQKNPMFMPSHMQKMAHLEAMNGAAFEVEFMEEMILHHLDGTKMATEVAMHAYHNPLMNAGEMMIFESGTHIAAMRQSLCQMYGVCHLQGGRRMDT